MKKIILISCEKISMVLAAKIFIRRVVVFISFLFSLQIASAQKNIEVKLLNDAVKNLTTVIVHDVYTPPVACRIYAYASIAAYEVLQQSSDSFPSYFGKLNGMPYLQESNGQMNYQLSSILAFYYTAQYFLSSFEMLNPFIDSTISYYRTILSEKEIINSQLWGSMMGMKMMSWAGEDHFKEIHTWPRYELIDAPDAWQPTPPDFADPVEPYWGKLRPFALDSVEAVRVDPRIQFSIDTGSAFYLEAEKIYRINHNLTEEQKVIADFWDDNPYTTYYAGHMQVGKKKISPAGHWMDITRIAIDKSGCDMIKAAEAYATVSIAMADGFIACWSVKYKYNLIRPETYINRYLDESWKPYLQTPPFPEFPSGHSVVSSAAATVLTYLFGEDFSFSDRVEVSFGLPERSFKSFKSAALEASYSRVLAGIHFENGAEAGYSQGIKVGRIIIEELLRN